LNTQNPRSLVIRIIAAILLAGLAFIIWNPRGQNPGSIEFDQIDSSTPNIQAQNFSQTPNSAIATATETLDADLPQITILIFTKTLSATQPGEESASPTQSPTPSPTLPFSLTPTPSDTSPTPSPTIPFSLTPAPTDTSTPNQTLTPTKNPSPTWTLTPSATKIPTNTWTPAPARLSGRLLLDSEVVEGNVTLILEDQSYNQVAKTDVLEDGKYSFESVPHNLDGYNVLFSQDQNVSFDPYKVISWGWFGPIIVQDGTVIDLPDFDISLHGLDYTQPIPDSQIPGSSITDNNALSFEWTGHPYAGEYWVTLIDENFVEIWKSELITETKVNFNGVLNDGQKIQPGQYWWGVGTYGNLGDFKVTVFGFLDGFTITP
jgi:hypothetical protein